jgi:hypothetical protein
LGEESIKKVAERSPLAIEELPLQREVEGHHAPVPFYVTRDMFGGLPVEIAGGEISNLVGHPVASPHTHDVPEVYLLLAPEPGGAVIDVHIEGRRHELVAPAAFFVPAGTLHHFVTRAATSGSYCLGILLGPFPDHYPSRPRPA